jgi:hypothetical protein
MTAIVPGAVGELLECLGAIDLQALRYELEKLRAAREWAFRQAGIDYEEGGKVRLRDDYRVSAQNRDGSPNGWWPYRECLTGGATGTAVRIDFSPHHMAWFTDFRPDREWSVSERGGGEAVRYWHGPAAETPASYEPPTAFDQERYPEGRRHVFGMLAADLAREADLS